MIEIENLRKSFGPLEVLKGINLTVANGEVVTIIGGSGSGKSTLLTCINGLEPINAGSIKIDGVEVHSKSTNINKLRQNVGIVFQQWNAFPHLTVLENVMLAPRKVLGMAKQQAEEIATKRALGNRCQGCSDGGHWRAIHIVVLERIANPKFEDGTTAFG